MAANVLEFKPRPNQERVIICVNCGAENSFSNNFCGGCGKALRPQRKSTKAKYAPQTKHTKVPLKTQSEVEAWERALTQGVRKRTAVRNLNLFDLGISVGLRASDLVTLKASNFVKKDGSQRDFLYVVEKKTGKGREIFIDRREFDSVCAYIEQAQILYDGWLFPSQQGDFITAKSLNDKIIVPTAKLMGLDSLYYGSHTLRKTFAYQFYTAANALSKERGYRALSILCRELNHSSEAITLSYIGIAKEEVQEICGLSADQVDWAKRQALREELEDE
jgi:integrase